MIAKNNVANFCFVKLLISYSAFTRHYIIDILVDFLLPASYNNNALILFF